MRNPNLRQELTRQPELIKRGYITQVDYEQAFLFIDHKLQRPQPSAQPEVRETILKHEAAATTDNPAYQEAKKVFSLRHGGGHIDPKPEWSNRLLLSSRTTRYISPCGARASFV